MGHRRGKQASWADKLAQIGQDTTCIWFWKVDQRGGSPDAIERLQVKGKVTEIGVNQRQCTISTSSRREQGLRPIHAHHTIATPTQVARILTSSTTKIQQSCIGRKTP